MKNNSIKKNLVFNIMYQALVTLTPLITTPYVSRVLGADNIGEYSYVLSIANYFCIFGLLGSSVYGQLLISKSRDNDNDCRKAFSIVFYSRLLTMAISMAVYTFVIYTFKFDSQLYWVLFIYFIAQTIDIAWFFQGLERFDITVPCNAIAKLLSIIGIFILIKDKEDTALYVGLINGAIIIGNALMWVSARKYIKLSRISTNEIFYSIKANFVFFIPTIASVIFGSLDKCMIGWITLSNFQNGYYEQASKIYNMLVAIITALTVVMLPRMAYLWKDDNNRDLIKTYISKTMRYVGVIVLPISIGLYVITPEFVPMFFGEGYEACVSIIRVFSAILVFTCFNSIISNQCLVANGKQAILNKLLIVSSIINVLLNCVFIYNWQALGAALASLISEFILLVLIVCKCKEFIHIKEWVKFMIKYAVFSLVMGIAVFSLKWIVPENAITLILEIVVGGLIYALCLILSKDIFMHEILKKL